MPQTAPDPVDALFAGASPSQQGSAPAAPSAQDPVDALFSGASAAQNQPTAPQSAGWPRALGLAGRAVTEGLTALPVLAGNAGIQAGNLLNNHVLPHLGIPAPNNELQPVDLQSVLNSAGFPQPQGLQEKAEDVIESGLTGAKLPTGVPEGAPANFVANSQQALKQAALTNAQKQGYVVPPSAANPTFMNRLLGGVAGKLKLQQEAMQRNQPVTDALAARGLGQTSGAPLTPGSLSAIRSEADAAGYAPVRAFGQMKNDQQFSDALDALTKSAQGANSAFPGIKPPQTALEGVVTALKSAPTFDSSGAVDTLSYLRSLGDDAYGAGQKSLGGAYKGASKALEDLIERNLQGAGQDGQQLLANFRNARTQMAKTYSVGKALEGDTGTVNARNLASQFNAGKPLSGDLRTIGQFSAAFPKATMVPKESFENVSPLDLYGSIIAAAETHNPLIAGLPLTRAGLRQYLLSSKGQARAIAPPYAPRTNMGLLCAIPAAGSGLLAP